MPLGNDVPRKSKDEDYENMGPTFRNLAPLTKDEIDACGAYQGDATHLHACSQGWSGQFPDSPNFQQFLARCPALAANLRTAIDKYEVDKPGIVYSGHGLGISVLGSLVGNPSQYVGFAYSYPGFTSTSEDRAAAENFLRTRSNGARLPVLFEIHLKPGQKALPYSDVTNQVGESEVLLPPAAKFTITAATLIVVQQVKQDVLQLILG